MSRWKTQEKKNRRNGFPKLSVSLHFVCVPSRRPRGTELVRKRESRSRAYFHFLFVSSALRRFALIGLAYQYLIHVPPQAPSIRSDMLRCTHSGRPRRRQKLSQRASDARQIIAIQLRNKTQNDFADGVSSAERIPA